MAGIEPSSPLCAKATTMKAPFGHVLVGYGGGGSSPCGENPLPAANDPRRWIYQTAAKGKTLASIISAAFAYPPPIPSRKCRCESGLSEGTKHVISA